MGRIRQMVKVDGRQCWTLFDTGARNTYVVPSVAQVLKTSPTPRTFRSAIGGEVKETNTAALLEAEIQGRSISTHAMVIDEIGNDEAAPRSRFSLVPWRCSSGGSDPYPTRSDSICHMTLRNSSSSNQSRLRECTLRQ